MDESKFGESLWRVHLDHIRVMDRIVEKSGVRGESGVLLYLYHVGRPMYPGELTEKLGLTTGRIANILRGLESAGLIARATDALDKRRVRVELTPEGEVWAQQQNAKAIAYYDRLLSRFTPEEARQYHGLATKMSEFIYQDMDDSDN